MTIGSFGIDPDDGQFTVEYGSRMVQTTNGTLVCLLPTLHTFNDEIVTWPDPPKDYIYAWRGWDDRHPDITPSFDDHEQVNTAQIFFTRTPQEYESSQVLMAAPDGADFFVGWVRLSRTTDPTHQWYGRDVFPLQKEDVWIPWMGSGKMEAALGMVRAMHLVIEGGNLVLVAHQSVGPACGGAVHQWGTYPANTIFSTNGDHSGGNFVVNTTPGIVVWTSTSSPYRKTSARVESTDGNPADFTTHQLGDSDPVTTTDPTDYESVYSVDVRGYFGRRS